MVTSMLFLVDRCGAIIFIRPYALYNSCKFLVKVVFLYQTHDVIGIRALGFARVS